MPCKICSADRCYEHCQKTTDGRHVPDPAGITPADGAGRNRGTDWIVDISCKKCGALGSTRINPEDVQWA